MTNASKRFIFGAKVLKKQVIWNKLNLSIVLSMEIDLEVASGEQDKPDVGSNSGFDVVVDSAVGIDIEEEPVNSPVFSECGNAVILYSTIESFALEQRAELYGSMAYFIQAICLLISI
ncbi:hypothetical protein PanWU01x14_301920 [Parasponia andersonii]|uniref:Uncharacterized protein n=1 Tax=Parasponia andersonii TaxID=3476 RepID=A0A2P5ATK8_PARAD|nr:hypothetical protein PanWU01x14_301920 [Parasponia andersonii]